MAELLQTPGANWVITLAVLASLVTVGVYLVGKVRTGFRAAGPAASDLISNFRELHSAGKISDAEYRKIKTKLAARLQTELAPVEDAAESPLDEEEPPRPPG